MRCEYRARSVPDQRKKKLDDTEAAPESTSKARAGGNLCLQGQDMAKLLYSQKGVDRILDVRVTEQKERKKPLEGACESTLRCSLYVIRIN